MTKIGYVFRIPYRAGVTERIAEAITFQTGFRVRSKGESLILDVYIYSHLDYIDDIESFEVEILASQAKNQEEFEKHCKDSLFVLVFIGSDGNVAGTKAIKNPILI